MNHPSNDPSGKKKNDMIESIRNFLRGKHSAEGDQLFGNWWDSHTEQSGELEEVELQAMSDAVMRRLKDKMPGEGAVVDLRHRRRRIKWLAAAAVVVLVCAGTYFWRQALRPAPEDWQIAVTGRGERRTLALADGTVITLRESSQLRYHQMYNNKSTREVRLEGEAFFDVAKGSDHPFIVTARRAEVKVLGTRFEVLSRQSDSSVVVAMEEGKVSLRDARNNAGTVILEKGDIGVLSREGRASRETATAETDNYFTWMDNRGLNFDNTPLSGVILQLKRIYGCSIVLDDPSLLQRKLTLQYPRSDLPTILRVIGSTMNAAVKCTNGVYHIK